MKVLVRSIEIAFYLSVIICLLVILAGCKPSSGEKKIGIIVPIEHKAMNEIVAGFTETLRASTSVPFRIKVANAQGDINLERAIIQQMKNENYDIIVPIGTDATQMSATMIPSQPIVSLAASITQQERVQRKHCNIAVVHDEISADQLIQFIHLVNPQLKRIALIHSASDKVFPEVTAAVAAGKRYGIELKPMMVPTLNELYSTANNIPADMQGILVLKDSLIVSGISTLEITAEKRHIPLITSDQGSVQDGAAFALGVHERQIGTEGAALAADVLNGKPVCSLPMVDMTKLTIFVNKSSLDKEQQSLTAIQTAASKLNYKLEMVDKKSGS
jgi:putative ABC transport system substrate-binding protein